MFPPICDIIFSVHSTKPEDKFSIETEIATSLATTLPGTEIPFWEMFLQGAGGVSHSCLSPLFHSISDLLLFHFLAMQSSS